MLSELAAIAPWTLERAVRGLFAVAVAIALVACGRSDSKPQPVATAPVAAPTTRDAAPTPDAAPPMVVHEVSEAPWCADDLPLDRGRWRRAGELPVHVPPCEGIEPLKAKLIAVAALPRPRALAARRKILKEAHTVFSILVPPGHPIAFDSRRVHHHHIHVRFDS